MALTEPQNSDTVPQISISGRRVSQDGGEARVGLPPGRGGRSPSPSHEAKGREGLNEEKQQALTTALGQIHRDHGKGAIMKLGEVSAKANVEAISTGALTLDVALGVGGVPRGRVVEIFGP